jgi:ankyrin repeat protein
VAWNWQSHLFAFDYRAQQGNTPLHVAVEEENVPMIEFLLAHGADPSTSNAESATPLSMASPHIKRVIAEQMSS